MEPMEQRRSALVALINEKGSVSFAQMKEAFPQVSEMTLRTDLKALDEAKRIVRVHGGARSVQVVVGTDDYYGRRVIRSADAKERIGAKAVELLRPGTALFLDSGSTTTAMARQFPDQPNLIYTSGLSCAIELARLKQPSVYLPGGKLNRYSRSVCGPQAIYELERIHFDQVFLGVTCYSPETGFTCGAGEEAMLKRTVLRHTDQVIVLMDSTKVGLKNTYSICSLQEVDVLVSDDRLPQELLQACAQAGVQVR